IDKYCRNETYGSPSLATSKLDSGQSTSRMAKNTKRILMFAQLHSLLGCLFIAESDGENGGRCSNQETGASQLDKAHRSSFFSPLSNCVIAGPGKGEEPSGESPPPDSDRV